MSSFIFGGSLYPGLYENILCFVITLECLKTFKVDIQCDTCHDWRGCLGHTAIKCSGWVFYEDCLVVGEYSYTDMLN